MKTAKEMFSDLGFKIIYDSDNILEYYHNEMNYDIKFYLKKQRYQLGFQGYARSTNIDIHLIIHKQMQELGWIE